jgi:hypothetical protein
MLPDIRPRAIAFSNDGNTVYLGMFAETPVQVFKKYISDFIVGPIFEKILSLQSEETIFRGTDENFGGGTLWGNIDQFSLWTLIYFWACLEITSAEEENRNVSSNSFSNDQGMISVPLFFFVKDNFATDDGFLKFYFSKQSVLFFASEYESLSNTQGKLEKIEETELGILDSIPMFHTHIRNRIVNSSMDFTDRIIEASEAAPISGSLEGIQNGAQFLRAIWDNVGNLKILTTRTQLLQSLFEANIEKNNLNFASTKNYDNLIRDDSRRVSQRAYLEMLQKLLLEFGFSSSLAGNTASESFRDNTKIVLTGAPILSGFWESSPVRDIEMRFSSLLTDLRFSYYYTVDDGLWAFPKDSNYRYFMIDEGSIDTPSPVTLDDFIDKYWDFYRFEDGAIRKFNRQELIRLYEDKDFFPSDYKNIIYSLLLSESMKIWLNEIAGLNLKETDFSGNSFPGLSFSEKGIIRPYDRRPFDRLYCLPWSPELLYTIDDRSRVFPSAEVWELQEFVARTIQSDFTIGELEAKWTGPSYTGVSTWKRQVL